MKLFLFFSCCFLSIVVVSQNSLCLISSDGKAFRVWEKGQALTEVFQAQVTLDYLTRDTMNLELEFENKKKYPVTVYLLEKGKSCTDKEFNYRLLCDNIKLKLIYSGSYPKHTLPAPLVPAKPVIDTSQNYKNKPLGRFCELRDGQIIYYNNIPGDGKCEQAMPADYMNYTARLISQATLKGQPFTIVENVCKHNCFSVAQLAVLLGYLEFELDKLNIIRTAYKHVTDPENKKQLESCFRFEASLRELNQWIKIPASNHTTAATNCSGPASQIVLERYIAKLKEQKNDTERLEVFKKSVAGLCYESRQALSILNTFEREHEKLEAAKLIYPHCLNKEEMRLIADVFSSEQNKKEILDFYEKPHK